MSQEKTPEAVRESIPVMHCFDNHYVIPAAVSFYSMLHHADPGYDYNLYVLHTDITWQNRQKLADVAAKFPNASLAFIDMQNRFDDIWQNLRHAGHYSKEVLYKLLAPSVFPQYEKIIITDVDVVFLGDIAPSFFAFDAARPVCFAGVRQATPKGTWVERYYEDNYPEFFRLCGDGSSMADLKACGGYLVANLRELRRTGMEQVFIGYLRKNSRHLLQSEQDVINFCCSQDQILPLPLKYVVCSYLYDFTREDGSYPPVPSYTTPEVRDALAHPVQLHYATHIKPWTDPTCTKADVWYSRLIQSGAFYDFFRRQKALETGAVERIPREEVRKGREENTSPTAVSVLCCTYNHENYIRRALEGIFAQRTDHAFEVIVSDDASTDGTQAIIREFMDRYPQQMKKSVLRAQNVGIGTNYYEALRRVDGRYLAVCDGDDEWTDPAKLQRQVDFLERNPDYTVCCSSFLNHRDGDGGQDAVFRVDGYIRETMPLKDGYGFEDLLNCRFIASCTVMLRWQLRGCVPEFLKGYSVVDFPLCLIHAACGKIKVMSDAVFSRHNVHGGSVSVRKSESMPRESLRLASEVNQFLDYRFSSQVDNYAAALKCGPGQASAPQKRALLRRIYHNALRPVFHRIFNALRRLPLKRPR